MQLSNLRQTLVFVFREIKFLIQTPGTVLFVRKQKALQKMGSFLFYCL